MKGPGRIAHPCQTALGTRREKAPAGTEWHCGSYPSPWSPRKAPKARSRRPTYLVQSPQPTVEWLVALAPTLKVEAEDGW